MRQILLTATITLLSVLTGSIHAQGVLPPVQQGHVTARLRMLNDDLPVNTYISPADKTFYFGPTDLATIPGVDDKFVITTHQGKALTIQPDGTIISTFLDLGNQNGPNYNPNLQIAPIQGMTAMVFHPEFQNEDHAGFLKFYTLEPEHKTAGAVDFADSVLRGNHHQEVVYEYRLAEPTSTSCDVTCFDTRREIMRVDQPGLHHNLGDLVFDTSGMLLISSGDGDNEIPREGPAISDNSQLLTNVYGKILRVDPFGSNSANGNYGIPADNPFLDGPGPNVDEIYAYGLRNPYRMNMDPETGNLYVSETGQLEVESIKQIIRGGNHGWNFKEGSFLFDPATQGVTPDPDSDGDGRPDFAFEHGLIEPVLEYGHETRFASIIGSAFYRGTEFPELDGKLVFGDHTRQRLFYGDPKTGVIREFALNGDSESVPRIFDVKIDAQGDLYVLGLSSHDEHAKGVLLRIERPTLAGDFDHDQLLTHSDIDALTATSLDSPNDLSFDLSGDEIVDDIDRQIWVKRLKATHFGDANLDGEFNSRDLIQVFIAGEYEDDRQENSTWETGDWNGDREFTTADLVTAFIDGGYLRNVANQVPEPTSPWIVTTALFIIGIRRCRR